MSKLIYFAYIFTWFPLLVLVESRQLFLKLIFSLSQMLFTLSAVYYVPTKQNENCYFKIQKANLEAYTTNATTYYATQYIPIYPFRNFLKTTIALMKLESKNQYPKLVHLPFATHSYFQLSRYTLVWAQILKPPSFLPDLAGKVNIILDPVKSLHLTSLKYFSQPGKNVVIS